jgi:aspartyl/glutamyl-tRNA(Asn/Gln) amidotransferase C subunit
MKNKKTDMCPETKAKVLRYSKLARLIHHDCPEEQADDYIDFFNEKTFDDVLQMIQSLETINTEGVKEQFAFFDDMKQRNIREDLVNDGEMKAAIMANAKSQAGYFVVPAVIDSE